MEERNEKDHPKTKKKKKKGEGVIDWGVKEHRESIQWVEGGNRSNGALVFSFLFLFLFFAVSWLWVVFEFFFFFFPILREGKLLKPFFSFSHFWECGMQASIMMRQGCYARKKQFSAS
jgi:hypothetical protein